LVTFFDKNQTEQKINTLATPVTISLCQPSNFGGEFSELSEGLLFTEKMFKEISE